MATALQAADPEDILRDLPSPEVNYPVDEIRIRPAPESLATDPVPLPPPARPYEIRKLVEKAKETTANPIVKTTRKIVETLSRPKAKVATHSLALASASRSITPGTQNTAAAKPQQSEQPTWVVKAAKTLAGNPVFTMLDTKIASEAAFTRDVFDLYVNGYESEEKPAEEEKPVAKFDSIMVTATGLQKKAQWQELKNLFSENPEAGETVEGLRFQIEAEINSAKPNYMSAQRFARQLLESEGDDPLGHYAMALFYYNSKKPNLIQAKKSLDIALKAKNSPAGASSLYWTMTLKGLAIPLLLVIAGLAGGVAHLIKKRKAAAAAAQLESEETPAKDAGQNAQTASSEGMPPGSGFKAKLQAISEKARELLKKLPFGKGKGKQQSASEENVSAPAEPSTSAAETGRQSEKPVETPVEQEIENSEDDEEEIYELEGEDSELLEDNDSGAVEEETGEQESSDEVEEIIEEILIEEDEEETATDDVEIVEVEEEADETTETVEEVIEEIVEEEEVEVEEEVEIEEVEYEIEEEVEVEAEDESEEKG